MYLKSLLVSQIGKYPKQRILTLGSIFWINLVSLEYLTLKWVQKHTVESCKQTDLMYRSTSGINRHFCEKNILGYFIESRVLTNIFFFWNFIQTEVCLRDSTVDENGLVSDILARLDALYCCTLQMKGFVNFYH